MIGTQRAVKTKRGASRRLFCATPPHPHTVRKIRSNRQWAQCGGRAERPQPLGCSHVGTGDGSPWACRASGSPAGGDNSGWYRWWRSPADTGKYRLATTRKTPAGSGRARAPAPGGKAGQRRFPKGPSASVAAMVAIAWRARARLLGFSSAGRGHVACLVARLADIEKRPGQPRAIRFFFHRAPGCKGAPDVVRQDDGGRA